MNIFRQEFRTAVPSMLYWTAAMLFFVFLFMFMYPPISKDVSVIESILSNFPVELRRALGFTTLNLSQLLGFYGFIFVYVLLFGSIYAMKSGLSVLSEEMRTRTTDFLLAKPVSRSVIVSAKILSVLTHIIIQNILFMLISYIIVSAYQTGFNTTAFALINLSLLQVQLFFVAAGLFLSVIIKRIKTVLPLTLGIVFGFFVIQMINQSLQDPKLAYITPFAYFDVAQIIQTVSYDASFQFTNWIIVLLLTALSYMIYLKKDMPSL